MCVFFKLVFLFVVPVSDVGYFSVVDAKPNQILTKPRFFWGKPEFLFASRRWCFSSKRQAYGICDHRAAWLTASEEIPSLWQKALGSSYLGL